MKPFGAQTPDPSRARWALGHKGLARSKLDETPSIGRGMGGFCRHFALPLCYLGHHPHRKFSRIKTNILMVLHAIPRID